MCRVQGYAAQTSMYAGRPGKALRVGSSHKVVDSSNSSAFVWSVVHMLLCWERPSKAYLCKSSWSQKASSHYKQLRSAISLSIQGWWANSLLVIHNKCDSLMAARYESYSQMLPNLYLTACLDLLLRHSSSWSSDSWWSPWTDRDSCGWLIAVLLMHVKQIGAIKDNFGHCRCC